MRDNVMRIFEMAQDVEMTEPVLEFRGNFTDVVAIQELRGSYPNVPISSDIDYPALIAGDDNPMFVSLPIGKANVVSGNKRFYDEAWLLELERQVLAKRPIGLMGHLPTDQRGWAMPPESLHWVGAMREGDTLWGKAYVVPGDTKNRLARYKAQNKAIATSIDAVAQGIWDESIGAYRMDAKSLQLGQIDLAPTDRAGIPALASIPVVTSEMQDATHAPEIAIEPEPEPDSEPEQEGPDMDREEIIKSITAEEVPETVRNSIASQAAAEAVRELRSELGLAEGADVAAHVRELQAAEAQREQEAVSAKITELVSGGVKLQSARGIVTELVTAKQPASVQEAETAFNEVMESDNVKTLLGAQVREIMGPNQTTGVQSQSTGNRYFQIPANGVPGE